MRSLVLFPLMVALNMALPAFARNEPDELVDRWQQRLAETESALKTGDYSRAMRVSDRTVSEMAERLGPGEGSTRLFSNALLQKALAHAGLGEHGEAAWYWQVVLGLDPKLGTVLRLRHGEGGTGRVRPAVRAARRPASETAAA